jgi:hypothetical protein
MGSKKIFQAPGKTELKNRGFHSEVKARTENNESLNIRTPHFDKSQIHRTREVRNV